MAATQHPTVRLVDPTGDDPGPRSMGLAPRPVDLRGKRLGLLDNSKVNSEFILRIIAGALDEEFEFADIFYTKKHSAALPPKPEVTAELLKHSDIVITGVGD